MSNPRFQFPGFVLRTTRDTPTHDVEVGTIEDGGNAFVLEMLRNNKLTDLPFVVSCIWNADERVLWQYAKERNLNGFNGIGQVVLVSDHPAIVLVGRGRNGKVERVIPFSSLIAGSPALGMSAQLALKQAAAKSVGRDVDITTAERRIVAVQAAKAEEAAQEAKKQAREERVRSIMARGQITAFTSEGREVHGTPALESEWPSLHKGTHVILVDSIGETAGKPLEAFRVARESGRNPTKEAKTVVFASRPATGTSASQLMLVRPTRMAFIEKSDDIFEVQVFTTMDQIREARKQGLNGGTYVGLMTKTPRTLQVFAVHHDRVDTIGNFPEYA